MLLAKPTYYKIIPLSAITCDFYDKGVKPDQDKYAEWVIHTIKTHKTETDPDAEPARKSHMTTTLPHLDNYLMNNKYWKKYCWGLKNTLSLFVRKEFVSLQILAFNKETAHSEIEYARRTTL